MSDDYPTAERSNAEVRGLARKTLTFSGIEYPHFVDVCSLVRRPYIETVFGLKELRYRVVPDHEMKGDDGLTLYDGTVVTILVKRCVDNEASMGLGRARNTLAHELAHAVMHEGAPKARRSVKVDRVVWIPFFKSAEHQAKVFAAALLIVDDVAEHLETAEEISITFGVSLFSAEIYIKDREQDRTRRSGNSKVRALAEEFLAEQRPLLSELSFLPEPCPRCGQCKLFPIASKFMCKNCDLIQDTFQDGDRIS